MRKAGSTPSIELIFKGKLSIAWISLQNFSNVFMKLIPSSSPQPGLYLLLTGS